METMRGVAVSVESIRWPLIYVIVVEHVSQHDLNFFKSGLDMQTKIKISPDLFPLNKCAFVLLKQVTDFTLDVATGGFPYGGRKCELITETMAFQ